jgi:phage shock protein A
MDLNKFNAQYTGQEIIEKLQDDNKYLREILVEEKTKTEKNIQALHSSLSEFKEENTYLSNQLEEYKRKLKEINKNH